MASLFALLYNNPPKKENRYVVLFCHVLNVKYEELSLLSVIIRNQNYKMLPIF